MPKSAAALALVVVLCALLSACGSSSPSRAESADASIVAAALAQKSVHWTGFNLVANLSDFKTTGDVTTDSGAQTIAYLDNHTNRFDTLVHLRLVNHTVYIRGDADGLLQTLNDQRDGPVHLTVDQYDRPVNLTGPQARRYAGQWISIPQGDKLYAQTAEGLTLAAIVNSVAPMAVHGRWKLKKRGPGPNFLVGPTGRYLTAHRRGEPLPIAFRQGGFRSDDGVRFSKWNEPVHVRAPATSTPIATVRRS